MLGQKWKRKWEDHLGDLYLVLMVILDLFCCLGEGGFVVVVEAGPIERSKKHHDGRTA